MYTEHRVAVKAHVRCARRAGAHAWASSGNILTCVHGGKCKQCACCAIHGPVAQTDMYLHNTTAHALPTDNPREGSPAQEWRGPQGGGGRCPPTACNCG